MKKGKVGGFNEEGEPVEIDGLVRDPIALNNYLGRELGVALQLDQERSLASALQNPETFITDREKNINNIMKGPVAAAFERAVNDLREIKLPEEMFESLVKKRAQNALAEAMEIENLRHPGYEFAINKQKQARALMEDRGSNADDIIAAYKAKRKAKKAAKRAAQ